MKSSLWKNLWLAFAIFSPNFPNFKRISQVSTHLFLQRHDLVVFGLEFGGKLFIFNLDFMNCCLNPSQLRGHLLRNEKIIKKKITLLFCKASTMIISKNYFKTKFFLKNWRLKYFSQNFSEKSKKLKNKINKPSGQNARSRGSPWKVSSWPSGLRCQTCEFLRQRSVPVEKNRIFENQSSTFSNFQQTVGIFKKWIFKTFFSLSNNYFEIKFFLEKI